MTVTLTREQLEIVALNEGCFLVEAPPGAGKTQVLTERVRRLLLESPASTYRILGLTFTTKAAENLRSRVLDISKDAAKRVTAETFHGFCLTVLRTHGDRVGFPSNPTIYERLVDRREALIRAIEEEGLPPGDKRQLDEMLKAISAEKRRLRGPGESEDADLSIVYAGYQRVLAESSACDFDDLLVLTWRLFTGHAAVAEHYRRLYRFILVDEAQDTSYVQYEILKALCRDEHRSLMLVADKAQGIYGFAGASTEYLEAFVADFGATRLTLTHNFRSAKAVLAVANALVVHDDRLRKPSVDAVGAPGFAGAFALPSEQEEAEFVSSSVRGMLAKGLRSQWLVEGEGTGVEPEDIAILGRSRYCLKEVLGALNRPEPVPHFFSAGEGGLFDAGPVRLLIDGLRLVSNPQDQGTKRTLAKDWSAPYPGTPAEIFKAIEARGIVAPIAALLLKLDAVAQVRPLDINPFMLEAIRILKAVAAGARGGSADTEDAARLALDAETFEERWAEYRGPLAPAQRTIGGFLGALALSGRSIIRAAGVRVLTIHAAKGLEFRVVFLVGMNERTLPDYRSMGSERGVREERRNAYVAVTRAARVLVLTRPSSRTTPWGALEATQPSRFIQEMGLSMTAPTAERDI